MFMLGKAIALLITTGALALVAVLGSFFIMSTVYAGKGYHLELGQRGVLAAVLGAVLYASLSAVMALGIGAIVRHAAAAITVMVVIQFILGIVLLAFGKTAAKIAEWLPAGVGGRMTMIDPSGWNPGSWLAMIGYAGVALAAGIALLRTRDA